MKFNKKKRSNWDKTWKLLTIDLVAYSALLNPCLCCDRVHCSLQDVSKEEPHGHSPFYKPYMAFLVALDTSVRAFRLFQGTKQRVAPFTHGEHLLDVLDVLRVPNEDSNHLANNH